MIYELRRLFGTIPTIFLVSLLFAVGCGNVETADDDDATTEAPGDDDTTPVEVTPSATPCTDFDGDGYCIADNDCDDNDPSTYPGADETCVPGSPRDQDCNGVNACDEDNDGDGYSVNQGDCNDADNAIAPNAYEACDGVVDENCNGIEGDGCSYHDDDGDGQSEDEGDCDDADPLVYYGSPEHFDGVDNNCDGEIEQVVTLDPAADMTLNGESREEYLGKSLAGVNPTEEAASFDGDAYADVLIGAPGWGGGSINGAAKLVTGSASLAPGGTPPTPVVFSEESQSVARAGSAVAAIGDFNRDMVMDIAVGAPNYDSKLGTDGGMVYLIYGKDASWSSKPLSAAASAVMPGLQNYDYVGTALAGGNVNGDEFSDMLVGSPSVNSGGYLQIVPGQGSNVSSPIQLSNLAYLEPPAEFADMGMGQALAFVGDTTGDGLGDLVISGPYTSSREGVVIWIPGTSDFRAGQHFTSFDDLSAVLLTGDTENANMGWSISGNGDVNGDAYPDFMVGAEANSSMADPVAMMFLGGDAFMAGAPEAGSYPIGDEASVKIYAAADNVCPCAVAMNGDMNGDGFDDILVGTAGGSAVYVILGRETFPTTMYLEQDAAYILRGADSTDGTGYAVAWVGSFNGDGYDDFVIGAPYADLEDGTVDGGSVYFMFGFDTSSSQ